MTKIGKTLLAAAVLAIGAGGSSIAFAADVKVNLTGASEVPPVKTSATGEGTISIGDDGAVSGSVATKGIQGTAAHIHATRRCPG